MEFRILGPLEVWDGGGEVSLGGPKPRALLALLLLHPNEVVPADRMIEELWGEDSPERAAAALRVNVSRLRKALPQDVLTTRSPGYVIRVEPDALDLHRFERLDQPVVGNNLVWVEEKHGEKRTRLGPAQGNLAAFVPDLERPQDAELHRAVLPLRCEGFQAARDGCAGPVSTETRPRLGRRSTAVLHGRSSAWELG